MAKKSEARAIAPMLLLHRPNSSSQSTNDVPDTRYSTRNEWRLLAVSKRQLQAISNLNRSVTNVRNSCPKRTRPCGIDRGMWSRRPWPLTGLNVCDSKHADVAAEHMCSALHYPSRYLQFVSACERIRRDCSVGAPTLTVLSPYLQSQVWMANGWVYRPAKAAHAPSGPALAT